MSQRGQLCEEADHKVRGVMRLMRGLGSQDDDGAGLRALQERIDQFFVQAAAAPSPVCLETSTDDHLEAECDHPMAAASASSSENEVHLAVVAGVLEPRPLMPLSRVEGVVLPTAENTKQLDFQRMQQSHAMLNLFSALMHPPSAADPVRHTTRGAAAAATVEQHDDDGVASSSSSECVYMNASSCDDESDHDNDSAAPVPKKRLIEEL